MAACKPSAGQELSEDLAFAVLEEVDVEVDRGVDDGEEVREVGGVLHPGGPHKVLLQRSFYKFLSNIVKTEFNIGVAKACRDHTKVEMSLKR